jgi:hypothetical protein
MADVRFPRLGKEATIEEIRDALAKLRRQYLFLMENLDEENVIRAKEAIIANILAGTITADQIDTTLAKIQTGQIESLIVGTNVTMGPYARISWMNVDNQPDIANIALDTIDGTYLDANGIITKQVAATRINTLYGKIGTAQIENLTVGLNVQMGPTATISWLNVNGRPNTTYIDSSGLYTGTIQADKITGGEMTAVNSLRIGSPSDNNNEKSLYFNNTANFRTYQTGLGQNGIQLSAERLRLLGVTMIEGTWNFNGATMNFNGASVLNFPAASHAHSNYCTVQLFGGYLEFWQNGQLIGKCLAQ